MALEAALHHLQVQSPDTSRLARFYADALDMTSRELSGGRFFCAGPDRALILAPGQPKRMDFAAFAVSGPAQLNALRTRIERRRTRLAPSPSPLLLETFCVTDPDGNRFVFGLAENDGDARRPGLMGRLQHVVVASSNIDRIEAFYADVLGFTVSDRVFNAQGDMTASFMRCSSEHHSIAVFRAPESRLDHYCFEAGDWGLIRDWADKFARLRIPIAWGPGRHGPGDNLFIFVHDPDGNFVEISAELEMVKADKPAGVWPHEERTLNLWGHALMRS